VKVLAVVAAISGFLAVAFGAFGAHALRAIVAPDMLSVWQTAVHYQMFHALALLFIVVLSRQKPNALLRLSGYLFVLGTVLFSGSLYLMVITGIKALGMITPIGGVLFLCGWLALAFALVRFFSDES
jgi:uncharacterized membrane protein YgdD (TMEM256/DUF423 family)